MFFFISKYVYIILVPVNHMRYFVEIMITVSNSIYFCSIDYGFVIESYVLLVVVPFLLLFFVMINYVHYSLRKVRSFGPR